MAEQPIIFPSRRRWPHLLLGLVLGVAATVAAGVLIDTGGGDSATATELDLQLASAPVEIRDLIQDVDWVADLQYGDPVDVAAPAIGTVTAAVDVGTILRRGDTVVEIDEEPVAVFYGSIPAWRDLRVGDEGPDVAQLETNLVSLGYDPASVVTIDEEFTSGTKGMVEAWQEAMGLEVTGIFTIDSIVIVEGPVEVTSAPRVGDPAKAGSPLATVSARATTTTIVSTGPGLITEVAALGSEVEAGSVLYAIDGEAVMADEGGAQVLAVYVESDTTTTEPRPILEISTPTLSVVVPVNLADQDEWSVGQTVAITLPDESVVSGAVVDVGTVAQAAGQGQQPTIDVVIEISELVGDDLPASEVTVTVAGESALGAMVVPTRALLTLAEGGFGVEKILGDGSTVLVGVETGMFDDGVVEVTTSQLLVGDELVVPQ